MDSFVRQTGWAFAKRKPSLQPVMDHLLGAGALTLGKAAVGPVENGGIVRDIAHTDSRPIQVKLQARRHRELTVQTVEASNTRWARSKHTPVCVRSVVRMVLCVAAENECITTVRKAGCTTPISAGYTTLPRVKGFERLTRAL